MEDLPRRHGGGSMMIKCNYSTFFFQLYFLTANPKKEKKKEKTKWLDDFPFHGKNKQTIEENSYFRRKARKYPNP